MVVSVTLSESDRCEPDHHGAGDRKLPGDVSRRRLCSLLEVCLKTKGVGTDLDR